MERKPTVVKRSELLQSIAKTIADYRAGEIPEPTPDHVENWLNQFDESVQLPILKETDHILKKTYLSKNAVEGFLSKVVVNEELTGGDPHLYWPSVKFLDIQRRGNSQSEMLKMFGVTLESKCGLNLNDCSGTSEKFIYIDDGIYTGNRILEDIRSWICSDAPDEAELNVIVIVWHRGGQYYAKTKLNKVAKSVGKTININWWRFFELEDQRYCTDSSDVLRPTEIPHEQEVKDYVNSLNYPPVLRKPGSLGKKKFFSSEEGRHTLEQEFLKAGVHIRSMCPYLNEYQRPLGNSVLETLGFGSLLVTFRNCPNNAPLALWAGNPWYPLFPRKTN